MTTSHLSRRHALTNAMLLFASAGALAGAARAQDKIAQKTAGYQDQPDGQHRCGICAHFAPPNACQIVDGTVSPNGWCKLFAPKAE